MCLALYEWLYCIALHALCGISSISCPSVVGTATTVAREHSFANRRCQSIPRTIVTFPLRFIAISLVPYMYVHCVYMRTSVSHCSRPHSDTIWPPVCRWLRRGRFPIRFSLPERPHGQFAPLFRCLSSLLILSRTHSLIHSDSCRHTRPLFSICFGFKLLSLMLREKYVNITLVWHVRYSWAWMHAHTQERAHTETYNLKGIGISSLKFIICCRLIIPKYVRAYSEYGEHA